VRALLYIAGEADKNQADWNIDDKPKLLSEFNGLHIFHITHIIPVMKLFQNGNCKNLWARNDTFGFNHHNFGDNSNTINANQYSDLHPGGNFTDGKIVQDKTIVVATVGEAEFRAVTWEAPKKLKGFEILSNFIIEIVRDTNKCRHIPDWDYVPPGCKACNDIMTQEASSSLFLVRHSEALVPDKKILSIGVTGSKQSDVKKYKTDHRWDPSENTKSSRIAAFTYQGCLAYYIHSCMPEINKVNDLSDAAKNGVHSLIAGFAFLFLEIICLIHERYQGIAGNKRHKKAAYRYRGCIEFYLSYALWTLLCIDRVGGDGKEANKYVQMSFVKFHRYIFADVLKVMVLAEPQYAGCTEITDLVFQNAGILPGSDPLPPARRVAGVCKAFVKFYKNFMKPIFYRHLVSLEPNPALIANIENDNDVILYNKQKIAFEMIIEGASQTHVYHLMENAIVGETDTFIDKIGIQGVLDRWHDMMQLAPRGTLRLLESFIDNQKLQEYRNIQLSMRPDSFQPMISAEAAETIYIMCNALELPYEPSCKEELELLRVAPTCSPMRSIWRLLLLGAFGAPQEAELAA